MVTLFELEQGNELIEYEYISGLQMIGVIKFTAIHL